MRTPRKQPAINGGRQSMIHREENLVSINNDEAKFPFIRQTGQR